MDKKNIFITVLCILFCISLAGSGYLGFIIYKDSQVDQQNQVNKKFLDFRNMFEEKVLLSDKEIDFDTRLTLETAVRGLNNPAIFAQWQKFTNSQTKDDATTQAKALLELLINKTSS